MKRIETYIGQQVMEWCFSAQAQNEMVGLSKISAALLGTGVLANGLPCGPTSPASMTVQIGAGELYAMESLEATACGTLPADTAHQILKQGIQFSTFTTGTLAAPLTTGQSINYLIEAQYQDSDISVDPTDGASPVVLQFFDVDNPGVPWSGPNNSGSTSNTFRDGVIAYQVKAGTAATTGSQVTPTPDSGWTGLWVVSVPFAASTLTSGNISQYPAAPILPSSLLQSLITSNLTYGIDAGTANVIQATFPIPITALTDGMAVWVKIKSTNTGATTFTPNPGTVSAAPVVGLAQSALQGNELVANGRALFVWRQDITSWVLAMCTGASLQVAPATQSNQAVQFGQVVGVVGQAVNLKCVQTTAGTSLIYTADQIIAATALNGLPYLLPSFNQTLNGSTTGIGGLDTGALAANSFYSVYSALNPTTGTQGIFAQLEPSGGATTVYGGAHQPAGYTVTALIGVWPTNGSSQFIVASQYGRTLNFPATTLASGTAVVSTPTPVSAASLIPVAAKFIIGALSITTSGSSGFGTITLFDQVATGASSVFSAGSGQSSMFPKFPVLTAQTTYISVGVNVGTLIQYNASLVGFEF